MNRELRNKLTFMWSISLRQMSKIYNGGKIVSSIKMLGKLDSHIPKNETGLLSYAIHKNQLKID